MAQKEILLSLENAALKCEEAAAFITVAENDFDTQITELDAKIGEESDEEAVSRLEAEKTELTDARDALDTIEGFLTDTAADIRGHK